MPTDDGDADELDGRSIDDAVETVLADDPERDRDQVRSALEHVTEDGVVTRDAVDDALAATEAALDPPEERVADARAALADAEDAAASVTEYDVVGVRLEEYEDRIDALADRLDSLSETYGTVVDVAESTNSLYTVARGVDAVTAEAEAIERDAEGVAEELAGFEEWVADPGVRVEELAADTDALAETLGELERAADGVEGAAAADADHVGIPGSGTAAPSVAWFDVSVRHRMVGLLIEDLQVEAETLREWAADVDADTEVLVTTADRLDNLQHRHADLGDRLADVGDENWRAQYGEPLNALEGRFEAMEPPVDWNEVQATLEEYRTVLE